MPGPVRNKHDRQVEKNKSEAACQHYGSDFPTHIRENSGGRKDCKYNRNDIIISVSVPIPVTPQKACHSNTAKHDRQTRAQECNLSFAADPASGEQNQDGAGRKEPGITGPGNHIMPISLRIEKHAIPVGKEFFYGVDWNVNEAEYRLIPWKFLGEAELRPVHPQMRAA